MRTGQKRIVSREVDPDDAADWAFAEMIGVRIVALMAARGWLQGDLAKASGVTQCAISHYVRVLKQHPRVREMRRIAEAFGLKLSEFVEPDVDVVRLEKLRRGKNGA
jgi:transcriptional regulator with XRE-family HTH domain